MKTQQQTNLCLSDFGLKPQMTVGEVLLTLNLLRERVGEDVFMQNAKQVYHNLNELNPGATFNYTKYFTGIKLEIFLVVAHRYIIDNLNYEFTNDYSAIRRTN